MANKIVAATYGRTESGDDLPVLLWTYVPSNDDINVKYKELLPEEFEEVGFVSWVMERKPEVVSR